MNETSVGSPGDYSDPTVKQADGLISDKSLLRDIEFETGGVETMAKRGRVELESRVDQQEDIYDAFSRESLVLIESMKRQGASYLQAQVKERYFAENGVDIDLRDFSVTQRGNEGSDAIFEYMLNHINVELDADFKSLTELDEYLASNGRTLLITVDELMAIRDYGQNETLRIAELLAKLKRKKALKFLCQTHRNTVTLNALGSAEMADIEKVFVRPLGLDEISELLDRHFARHGVTFDEAAINKIIALTGGWPAETVTLVKTFYDKSAPLFNPRKTFTGSDIDSKKIEANLESAGLMNLIYNIYHQRLIEMFTEEEVRTLVKILRGEDVSNDQAVQALMHCCAVRKDKTGNLSINGILFSKCVEEISGRFK